MMKQIVLKLEAQERLLEEYPFFKLKASDIEAALPDACSSMPKKVFDAVFEFTYSHEDDYLLADFEIAASSEDSSDFYDWCSECAYLLSELEPSDAKYDLAQYCSSVLSEDNSFNQPAAAVIENCRQYIYEIWEPYVKKHKYEPNLKYVLRWLKENEIWHQ